MEEKYENKNSKESFLEDLYRNELRKSEKQLLVSSAVIGRLRGIVIYLCSLIDRSGDNFMKGIAQKIMVDIENFENFENDVKERLEKFTNSVDNPK